MLDVHTKWPNRKVMWNTLPNQILFPKHHLLCQIAAKHLPKALFFPHFFLLFFLLMKTKMASFNPDGHTSSHQIPSGKPPKIVKHSKNIHTLIYISYKQKWVSTTTSDSNHITIAQNIHHPYSSWSMVTHPIPLWELNCYWEQFWTMAEP